MSVHDTDKYPEIKRLLDIPEDEPIFILRAQDQIANLAIIDYISRCKGICSKMFIGDVSDVAMAFSSWRVRNPGKVKVPD